MPATPPFCLEKWYFDGVDAKGRTLIAYSAQLNWHGVRIPYSSYLFYNGPGDTRSESRFTQAGTPAAQGETIDLTYDGLPIDGRWTSACSAIHNRLFEDGEHYVDWHCRLPAAQCQVQVAQEPSLNGWGYVELLKMTLLPWQLGLQELRWGRFADPTWPVVWIEWMGKHPRRWIFADGQLIKNAGLVSEQRVQPPDASWSLTLENPVVLEDKRKIKEVLQSLSAFLPGIDRLAPLRFIQSAETKWRSEGTLIRPGHADRSGWVIHELVKF